MERTREGGHTVGVFGVTPTTPPPVQTGRRDAAIFPSSNRTERRRRLTSRYTFADKFSFSFLNAIYRRFSPPNARQPRFARTRTSWSPLSIRKTFDQPTRITMSDEQPKEQTNGTNDNNGVEQTGQEEQVKEDDR